VNPSTVNPDVIIVGAGPVGLMLGAELKLASVCVTIVERLNAPTGLSKALALVGRAQDYLDMRGLLERFRERSPALPFSPASLLHFGMLPLDISKTDLEPKGVFVPQSITEAILLEHALSLGVQVRTGVEVTGLAQTPHEAILTTSSGEELRARFVVGCDGAHSVIRNLAGIGFPTTKAKALLRLGDVKLAEGAAAPPFLVPLGDGYLRMITKEPLPEDFDRTTPMTLDELRDSGRRTFGIDIPLSEARWLSRFTDASGVADAYRRDRIFIAGDAAHIHLPSGGPGLLTGFGDALNLGFKLAAVIRDNADETLLDTYEAERRPVAQGVITHTRAQGVVSERSETGAAIREVMASLTSIPEVISRLLSRLGQLDTRYTHPGDAAHPLVGSFAPDGLVRTSAGPRRLVELLRDGRGLWLGPKPARDLRKLLGDYANRLRIEIAGRGLRQTCGAEAMLIRPDGHVAWASDGAPTITPDLGAALRRWFGPE
jgi:2-polyprenyl-6-methoxyphenol hydroxylase-like FAD-dependent oxidoreductase